MDQRSFSEIRVVRVRAGPRGFGRARVVEFSYKQRNKVSSGKVAAVIHRHAGRNKACTTVHSLYRLSEGVINDVRASFDTGGASSLNGKSFVNVNMLCVVTM